MKHTRKVRYNKRVLREIERIHACNALTMLCNSNSSNNAVNSSRVNNQHGLVASTPNLSNIKIAIDDFGREYLTNCN